MNSKVAVLYEPGGNLALRRASLVHGGRPWIDRTMLLVDPWIPTELCGGDRHPPVEIGDWAMDNGVVYLDDLPPGLVPLWAPERSERQCDTRTVIPQSADANTEAHAPVILRDVWAIVFVDVPISFSAELDGGPSVSADTAPEGSTTAQEGRVRMPMIMPYGVADAATGRVVLRLSSVADALPACLEDVLLFATEWEHAHRAALARAWYACAAYTEVRALWRYMHMAVARYAHARRRVVVWRTDRTLFVADGRVQTWSTQGFGLPTVVTSANTTRLLTAHDDADGVLRCPAGGWTDLAAEGEAVEHYDAWAPSDADVARVREYVPTHPGEPAGLIFARRDALDVVGVIPAEVLGAIRVDAGHASTVGRAHVCLLPRFSASADDTRALGSLSGVRWRKETAFAISNDAVERVRESFEVVRRLALEEQRDQAGSDAVRALLYTPEVTAWVEQAHAAAHVAQGSDPSAWLAHVLASEGTADGYSSAQEKAPVRALNVDEIAAEVGGVVEHPRMGVARVRDSALLGRTGRAVYYAETLVAAVPCVGVRDAARVRACVYLSDDGVRVQLTVEIGSRYRLAAHRHPRPA